MNLKSIPKFIFLCNGKKECCRSPFCYVNGGECKHTTSRVYSKNGYSDEKEPIVVDFEESKYENTLSVYFEKEN